MGMGVGKIAGMILIIVATFFILIFATGQYKNIIAQMEDNLQIPTQEYNDDMLNPQIDQFDTFFEEMYDVVYSSGEMCLYNLSLPDDFDDRVITITESSEGMVVEIGRTEGSVRENRQVDESETYNGIQPCIVYGEQAVGNFLFNNISREEIEQGTETKKEDYTTGRTYTFYDKDKIEVQTHSGDYYKANFQEGYLLIYKPDEDHVCFLPNKKKSIFKSKSDACYISEVLTKECIDKIDDDIPSCPLPVLSLTRVNGADDVMNIFTKEEIADDYNYLDFVLNLPLIDNNPDTHAIFLGLITQESHGDSTAESSTTAVGLTQLTQKTAYGLDVVKYDIPADSSDMASYCDSDGHCESIICDNEKCSNIDKRKDPLLSIQGGYETLKNKYNFIKKMANGRSTDDEMMKMALAAYNGGEAIVQSAFNRIPKTAVSWRDVAYEIEPGDITYFSDLDDKKAKVREIRNYVAYVYEYKTSFASQILEYEGAKIADQDEEETD